MNGIILIVLGLLLIIFSFPRVSRQIMLRLFNEGLVTPQKIKPEDAEIIRHAGPHISIFAVGILLIMAGLIITFY